MTASINTFTATWNRENIHLKTQVDPNTSTLSKVARFIISFIFFIPALCLEFFLRYSILSNTSLLNHFTILAERKKLTHLFSKTLPAAANRAHPYHDIEKNFTPEPFRVKTPDGATLQGHFFKHKNHTENSRVLMCFLGSGDFYENSRSRHISHLMHLLKDENPAYSFITFTARNVGTFFERPDSRTLRIDSDSIYQFTHQHLGISEDRIDLYGFCFGGAQAAALKALHPNAKGRLFLDRTFSSFDDLSARFLSFIPNFCSSFLRNLVKKFGWEFDVSGDMSKTKSKVFIFAHTKDPTITPICNLAYHTLRQSSQPDNVTITIFDGLKKPDANPHVTSITNLTLEAEETSNTDLLLNMFRDVPSQA